jgi:hypothetical protein
MPTLGWLLRLPMKFRPLEAMAPFLLYLFVVPIVAPNNGTMSPPKLHPGRASSINTPHRERQLSAGCCVFPRSLGHLRPWTHFLSIFLLFQLLPQTMVLRPPRRSTLAVPLLSTPLIMKANSQLVVASSHEVLAT